MTPQLMRIAALGVASDFSVGTALAAITGGGAPSSGTFPAANDAIAIPFALPQRAILKRLYAINGATVSGNIDIGLYTEDGGKLRTAGSTAQAGTSQPQFFNITDQYLSPGIYYIAVSLDNTTGTLFRVNLTTIRNSEIGAAKMASAFALPDTLTLAVTTSGFLPMIGAEVLALF